MNKAEMVKISDIPEGNSGTYTKEQIDIISRTIAPNLSKDEMAIFLHNCARTGLCPFARQIYAIKRGGTMCIQTGIDGFRLIAERTGKYSPGKDTEFLYDENGRLLGAKVYVKKMTACGKWHDISATAFLAEYNCGQGLWKKMPHVMLEKCAEARSLRRSFPADLSGLYSDDEMSQADANTAIPVKTEALDKPTISEETWNSLDNYLNGHDDLREKLKNLCNVTDLKNIKETQLKAVRHYVEEYKKRNGNSKKIT